MDVLRNANGLKASRYPQGRKRRPHLICYSHLRWNFVLQRPQHLLTRAAEEFDVLFVEEPRAEEVGEPRLEIERDAASGLRVVVPVLPRIAQRKWDQLQRALLDDLFESERLASAVGWYYTPMALPFSRHVPLDVRVYDCMDELSSFKGAPKELRRLEQELMRLADVVFTGGASLYAAKQSLHPNVHAFPSSIDVSHFRPARRARSRAHEPQDLAHIARPRIGFFGVLDERLDLELVAEVASLRPDWQFVMIGPVVKIDPESLPRRKNIRWLGAKHYNELPAYLAGLDVGWMPFAINDATRFISPTKTPEFLAAGLPLASTPIADVVASYGAKGLVEIAASTGEMVRRLEFLLARGIDAGWIRRVDAALRRTSWDQTWAGMRREIGAIAPLALGAVRGAAIRTADGLEPMSHV